MADDISIVIGVDSAPVDRAVRVMDNLEAEARDVERAFKSNLITEKQFNAETKRLAQSMNRLKTVAKGSAKDFRAFEKVVYGSGKALRAKEVQMQQAGYQLQDFIVQVQAGTNPMIAFSQQGSQLAGFFAGPWGAAIGLGIAALGGLGTVLLGTKEKAKTFQEKMEDLNSTLEDYDSLSKRLANGEGLSKEFGNLAEQARGILLALKEIQAISLKEKLGQFGGLGQVTSTTEVNAANYLRSLIGVAPVGPMETTMRDVDQVTAAQEFLGATEGTLMENSQYAGEFLRLLEQIQKAKTFEDMVEPAGKLSEFLARHVELFNVQGKKLEDVQAMQESLLQITALRAGEEEKANKAAAQAYTEAYTKAVLEVQRSQMANAKRLAKEEKDRAAGAEQHNNRMIALQNAHMVVNKKVAQEQKQGQDQVYHNALLAKQNAMALDITQEQERQKLADQTHAHMMALQTAYYEDAKKKASETASATYLANYKAVLAYQQMAETKGAAPTEPVEPPKTTGPTPTTIEDTIKNYRRQMAVEQALMSLTGERRREEELFLELKYANQDADIKTSETRLRGLAQEMAAMEERTRAIEEARQQQEELKNTIESSMEDAFMSIVDGTMTVKDAFRQMAADIIRELYRVLVVKQMVSAATSFFGFADGGVISKGNVVPYANGGVVGSPTYFPMAGGKTGLMGEAGPEAIMPLKRGKDGKLGVAVDGNQQQSVVINQSFNFAANGDDSVKRIIASEAPKIAKMTEAQILDNRRRGGQFRKAFA
jgi:hypothetical protein